jgi:hypothetical protein
VLDSKVKLRARRIDWRDRVGPRRIRLRLFPDSATSQEIDTTVVGDPEQLRRKRTRIVEGVELAIGVEQCVLRDILAVNY